MFRNPLARQVVRSFGFSGLGGLGMGVWIWDSCLEGMVSVMLGVFLVEEFAIRPCWSTYELTFAGIGPLLFPRPCAVCPCAGVSLCPRGAFAVPFCPGSLWDLTRIGPFLFSCPCALVVPSPCPCARDHCGTSLRLQGYPWAVLAVIGDC